jgi:hypothetical protein
MQYIVYAGKYRTSAKKLMKNQPSTCIQRARSLMSITNLVFGSTLTLTPDIDATFSNTVLALLPTIVLVNRRCFDELNGLCKLVAQRYQDVTSGDYNIIRRAQHAAFCMVFTHVLTRCPINGCYNLCEKTARRISPAVTTPPLAEWLIPGIERDSCMYQMYGDFATTLLDTVSAEEEMSMCFQNVLTRHIMERFALGGRPFSLLCNCQDDITAITENERDWHQAAMLVDMQIEEIKDMFLTAAKYPGISHHRIPAEIRPHVRHLVTMSEALTTKNSQTHV